MAYNPYENVLKVMDEAAQILGYSESDIEPLKYPERELKVSVPVEMDDGSTRVFEGYRVQHSTSRGCLSRRPIDNVSYRMEGLTIPCRQ